MRKSLAYLILGILFCLTILPLLFMFIPLVTELGLSKTSALLGQTFTQPKYLKLLKNTLLISLISTLGATLIGIIIAFGIERIRIPLASVFEYLCLFPLLIPQYLTAIGWIYLMGRNGILNTYLMESLGWSKPLFTVYGPGGVIFILILTYFPFVTLFTLIGLRTLDSRLEQSALLSNTKTRTFFFILLPLLLPYIGAGSIIVFIFSLGNFDVPSLLLVYLSNDYSYAFEIFTEFSAFYNTSKALILSLPLILTALATVGIWYWLMRKRPLTMMSSHWTRRASAQTNLVTRIIVGLFCGFIFLLAIILPLFTLIIKINSLSIIQDALRTASNHIWNSLELALLTTPLLLIIGFAGALVLERSKVPLKWSALIMTIIPFTLPGTILGIGLIRFYNHGGLLGLIYQSVFIVVIGCLGRFIILPLLILSSSLKGQDKSLENAALVSGLNRPRAMRGVIIPLMLRSFLISGVLSFILCLGELSVSIMVNPPGFTTLPVRIFSLMHFGEEEMVSALCLIVAALVIMAWIAFSILTPLEINRRKRIFSVTSNGTNT